MLEGNTFTPRTTSMSSLRPSTPPSSITKRFTPGNFQVGRTTSPVR